MKKVYLFGSGSTAFRVMSQINDDAEIIGFLDNDETKWGKIINGIKVIGNAAALKDKEFDEIIVCSLPGMGIMQQQLLDAGIPLHKINISYVETQVKARINFLEDFSKFRRNFNGIPVAEGGVFQGDFARHINRCFPKSKLYLFDTFSGFDKKDIKPLV